MPRTRDLTKIRDEFTGGLANGEGVVLTVVAFAEGALDSLDEESQFG